MMSNQNGAASLIGITLASFIILILTLGMVSLMIGELRQAADTENGIKAFYHAESEAERAVASVIAAPGNKLNLCQTGASPENLRLCIATDGTSYGSSFSTGDTEQIGLSPGRNPNAVRSVQLGVAFETKESYLEATMTSFKRNPDGSINISSPPEISTIFICPPGGSTCSGADPPSALTLNFYEAGRPRAERPQGNGGVFYPAGCGKKPDQPNYDSLCSIILENLSPSPGSYLNIIRFVKHGGGVIIQVNPRDAGGSPVTISFPSAIINSTARVGDSHVAVTESLVRQSSPPGNVANVLYGDRGLCKTFTVISDDQGPLLTDNSTQPPCPSN